LIAGPEGACRRRDLKKFDRFLSDPEMMYAGTRMGSPPIRDAKQRADLLCVLAGQ